MATSASGTSAIEHPEAPSRRDFLYIRPPPSARWARRPPWCRWSDQMNPDASTLAAGGPVDVDVSKIAEGSQIVVRWRERPIWIDHRANSPCRRCRARRTPRRCPTPMREPSAAALRGQLAPLAQARVRRTGRHLHTPGLHSAVLPGPERDFAGGQLDRRIFLPRHPSKYDAAGRVYSGVPAPYNLPAPPHRYLNDTTIRIGENPANSTWDFNSILQL